MGVDSQPADVERILDVPEGWALIAYLCVGYRSRNSYYGVGAAWMGATD